MRLKVGQIVDAVVSDYHDEETGSVMKRCRIEEIVDEKNEIVRLSPPGDPNPTESRIHGKVVREDPEEAWQAMVLALLDAGVPVQKQVVIIRRFLDWHDMEYRNSFRNIGRSV